MTVRRKLALALVLALACAPLVLAAPASAQEPHPGRTVVMSKCFQCHTDAMFRDHRQDRRGWEAAIYRMVGRGGLWTADEIKLMADYLGHRLRTQACQPRRDDAARRLPRVARSPREGEMRELVAKYLSQGISRRGFVGGLTKAGLTATAAQSVLELGRHGELRARRPGAAAGSAAPAAAPAHGPRRRRRRQRREIVPRPGRRLLCRAAHRLRREIRVRQFGQRRRAILRGAGRPAAAQIHPHAARGTRRRHGGGLHQGLRRAGDRDAGGGGRAWPTPSARCSTPSRSRRRSSSTPTAPTRRGAPDATASRRSPTRSRWSSRSPNTLGWRAGRT